MHKKWHFSEWYLLRNSAKVQQKGQCHESQNLSMAHAKKTHPTGPKIGFFQFCPGFSGCQNAKRDDQQHQKVEV